MVLTFSIVKKNITTVKDVLVLNISDIVHYQVFFKVRSTIIAKMRTEDATINEYYEFGWWKRN